MIRSSALRRRALLLPLVCALLLGACKSPYTPSPDRPFEKITEFNSSARIRLENVQDDVSEHVVGPYLADYKAWTEVAIQIAQRELTARGLEINTQADKVLKFSVDDATNAQRFMTTRSTIAMTVETDDGYTNRYTGINSSAVVVNIPRQLDGAMMRVVVEMLKDPKIVAYLIDG